MEMRTNIHKILDSSQKSQPGQAVSVECSQSIGLELRHTLRRQTDGCAQQEHGAP
jgi:hypothetical protein